MKKIIVMFIWVVLVVSSLQANAQQLSWKFCVSEALVSNYLLISAQEKLNQAKAQSWSAAAAALPQISISASASDSGSEPSLDSLPYTGNTKSQNYAYGLNVRQLVFDGFKNTHDIMKSSEDVKSAELNYKITSAQVRYNLKLAYVGLMKAQEMVTITGQILNLRKKQYEDVKLRYTAGRENKGAVLSSEADFKESEFEVAQAARSLELAKQILSTALGRDINSDISVTLDYTLKETLSVDPDFEALLNNNMNYLLLMSQRKAAEFSLNSSLGACFPQVTFSGSLGRSAKTLEINNTSWSLGLNVSYSLFDGGKLAAQSAASLAALRQAKADEKSGMYSGLNTIKTIWYDFKDAYLNLNVQQKYFEASQERATIADAQYSTGLIDFNNWTIIQNSLVSSQKSIISSQTDLLNAEAAWVQVKGGTLENETK
ncbi:MAG: TolC family protein [bacterium]